MDRTFRNNILDQLQADISKHTILKSLKREYTLEEISIMTRSAPAKILGLENKGSLSDGKDADITIYDALLKDPEEMFSHPTMVIKGGEIVVENKKIKKFVWGKTQVVKPQYDKSIKKHLENFCILFRDKIFPKKGLHLKYQHIRPH